MPESTELTTTPLEPPDELLSPTDLHRLIPKFGVSLQRNQREMGGFIPHIVVGKNRIFYRRSAVDQWLREQEAKAMSGRGAVDES